MTEPFFVKELKKYISYSVGNPMGAYSSWSSFTLAHHFIIYVACRRCNVNYTTCPYFLLGDDIVICHDKVASCYKELMEVLDVAVSPAKTHESKRFLEFAKRYFLNRKEISPFPLGALMESNRYYILAETLRNAKSKEFQCDPFVSTRSFYSVVRPFRVDTRKRLINYTITADIIHDHLLLNTPAYAVINSILRQ